MGVSRDLAVFHESNPPLPRLLAKMVLLKDSFCGDICEIRDSALTNTAGSRTLRGLTPRSFAGTHFVFAASPCFEKEYIKKFKKTFLHGQTFLLAC